MKGVCSALGLFYCRSGCGATVAPRTVRMRRVSSQLNCTAAIKASGILAHWRRSGIHDQRQGFEMVNRVLIDQRIGCDHEQRCQRQPTARRHPL
jgi:hypothetical protein